MATTRTTRKVVSLLRMMKSSDKMKERRIPPTLAQSHVGWILFYGLDRFSNWVLDEIKYVQTHSCALIGADGSTVIKDKHPHSSSSLPVIFMYS